MIVFNFASISSKLTSPVLLIGTKLSPVAKSAQPLRTITSLVHRVQDPNAPPKPAPFPYKEKKYGLFASLFDNTRARFDENTKLLVVDGPPTAGKGKLAKQLAEELGMLYMPDPPLSLSYMSPYGYDLRELNKKLPEDVQFVSEDMFVQNPNGHNSARMQVAKFRLRYEQHVDALAHIFNTGQGVVLTRCAYSDRVFTEAMLQQGYINQSFYTYYNQVWDNVMPFLLRPHLVIYLDVSPAEIKRRIQERKNPMEMNSPVYDEPFLKALEQAYKQRYLRDIGTHADLLVYDWSEGGDAEVVVEDIERVDLDQYGPYDLKMKDWRMPQPWHLDEARAQFTTNKHQLLSYFNIPTHNCPEVLSDGGHIVEAEKLIESVPGMAYAPGFNAAMGDSGLLLKMK